MDVSQRKFGFEALLVLSFALTLAAITNFSVCRAGIVDGVVTDGETTVVQSDGPIQTLGTPPPAGAVVIDFDDAPAPCVFAQTTALRNAYAALGVVFSGPGATHGGAVLDQCGNFGVSGYSAPNFLAFNAAARMADGGLPVFPETISFQSPVSYVQIDAAGGNGGGMTLTAFDAGGNNVDQHSLNMVRSVQTLSVSSPGIARVVVSYSAPGAQVAILDNLAFIPGGGELELIEAKLDLVEVKLDDQVDPTAALEALEAKLDRLGITVSQLAEVLTQLERAVEERARLEAKLDAMEVTLDRMHIRLGQAAEERAALETKLDEMTQRSLAPGQRNKE